MSALTKIFIVLQLVCSLVVAVVLVVALKGQAEYQKNANAEHVALLQAQSALAAQNNANAQVRSQVERLTSDVRNSKGESDRTISGLRDTLKQKDIELDTVKGSVNNESVKVQQLASANDSLAKENTRLHQEIEKIMPELTNLTTKNAELARANNELVTQVNFAGSTIRKLQEALQAAQAKAGGGAAMNGDTGSVAQLSQQTPAQINGKVVSAGVSAGRTLLEVGLGSRDGMKVGTHVVVSRNGNFIADAVVDKVTPEASVAVTTENVKKGDAPKAGDLVTAGNPQ